MIFKIKTSNTAESEGLFSKPGELSTTLWRLYHTDTLLVHVHFIFTPLSVLKTSRDMKIAKTNPFTKRQSQVIIFRSLHVLTNCTAVSLLKVKRVRGTQAMPLARRSHTTDWLFSSSYRWYWSPSRGW